MTPSAQTLGRLRKNGWYAESVERYISFGGPGGRGFRRDFLGFIDILAFRSDRKGVLGIQATSANKTSARERKVLNDPNLKEKLESWIAAGNSFAVWGWDGNRLKLGFHAGKNGVE